MKTAHDAIQCISSAIVKGRPGTTVEIQIEDFHILADRIRALEIGIYNQVREIDKSVRIARNAAAELMKIKGDDILPEINPSQDDITFLLDLLRQGAGEDSPEYKRACLAFPLAVKGQES